jgi:hypothetical protein
MTPARLAIVSLVLVVIGCAIAAVGTAPWLDAVGITVAGVGGVGLVSAAFYGVGESGAGRLSVPPGVWSSTDPTPRRHPGGQSSACSLRRR